MEPPDSVLLDEIERAGGALRPVTVSAVTGAVRDAGTNVSPGTARRRLSSMKRFVSFRTVGGKRLFILTPEALKRRGAFKSPHSAVFVRPGTSWTTQQQLKEFLGAQAKDGHLLVIDPYISEETLVCLAQVAIPIRILACHIGERGREADFRRTYDKFRHELGRDVEVRRLPAEELHGRYIFTGNRGWVVDHSLKNLGGKPAVVIPLHLDSVHPEIKKYFDDLFASGAVY